MKLVTKIFGEIEIDDSKIILFPHGIIGFPELSEFALIHDEEKGIGAIHWLQSIQEPAFAIPVMDPLIVCAEYNPPVEDDIFVPIGNLVENEILVLVTVTVPKELANMSVNLRGPIIINATTKKACQIILEGNDYDIKFPIYDILNERKAGE